MSSPRQKIHSPRERKDSCGRASVGVLSSLAVGMLAFAGCACHSRTPVVRADNMSNLIFAAPESALATRDVARSDWPAATAFEPTEDRIRYQERYIDIQGRSAESRDYTYRRFSSTRTGVRHR